MPEGATHSLETFVVEGTDLDHIAICQSPALGAIQQNRFDDTVVSTVSATS